MQGVATATAVLVTVRVTYRDGTHNDNKFTDAAVALRFAESMRAFPWVAAVEFVE
jgi:hypothetical protein